MKRTATKYALSQRKSKLRRIKARANARGGAGVPSSSRKKPELTDYSGNPMKFLTDFFTGGTLRK